MKKLTVLLIALLTFVAVIFTSCSAKTVTVRVLDEDGTVVCEETVELGAENPDSIAGKNVYALDCLEAALVQAKIEYNVNKSDVDAFVVTNIGEIASDKVTQFVYYRKDNAKSEFVDKTGLTAQHDEMEGGEVIEFRFESVASVNVRVVDNDDNVICEEVVKLGLKNEKSASGRTLTSFDCLETALTQAGITYEADKSNADEYVINKIGNLTADEINQFVYFTYNAKTEDYERVEDELPQVDELSDGRSIQFKYMPLAKVQVLVVNEKGDIVSDQEVEIDIEDPEIKSYALDTLEFALMQAGISCTVNRDNEEAWFVSEIGTTKFNARMGLTYYKKTASDSDFVDMSSTSAQFDEVEARDVIKFVYTPITYNTVDVRVVDAEGNAVCEQTVELAENVVTALDFLEAALVKAEIEYTINKENEKAYVITNIGELVTDDAAQFVYYKKDVTKTEFTTDEEVIAQNDKLIGGEAIEFRFETASEE